MLLLPGTVSAAINTGSNLSRCCIPSVTDGDATGQAGNGLALGGRFRTAFSPSLAAGCRGWGGVRDSLPSSGELLGIYSTHTPGSTHSLRGREDSSPFSLQLPLASACKSQFCSPSCLLRAQSSDSVTQQTSGQVCSGPGLGRGWGSAVNRSAGPPRPPETPAYSGLFWGMQAGPPPQAPKLSP